MRNALALALLLLAACQYDPRGSCDSSAECPKGQLCGGGVCAPPGAGPSNAAPLAVADAYPVPAGGLLDCPEATGVLANDTDADGGPLEAERVEETAHGRVYLEPNGAFRYLLTEEGYTGTDVFTYRASDGALRSAVTPVTLTIGAPPP
jgi:hypothetical protein